MTPKTPKFPLFSRVMGKTSSCGRLVSSREAVGLRAGVAVVGAVFLLGCTTIERLVVVTQAVDCNVERGQHQQLQTDVKADVLGQSGEGVNDLLQMLTSRIDCGGPDDASPAE